MSRVIIFVTRYSSSPTSRFLQTPSFAAGLLLPPWPQFIMQRLKSYPRLDYSLKHTIPAFAPHHWCHCSSSHAIILNNSHFLAYDTLSGYKGWLMNNIDPNITLGYRDVMVTNGGRRIGYNCCKYALPWDKLSKSSIALASVTILFVRLLFLSCWPFWNLAWQDTNASPRRKCQLRVGMATRIMHYLMIRKIEGAETLTR